jgi:hypothetical protein
MALLVKIIAYILKNSILPYQVPFCFGSTSKQNNENRLDRVCIY